MYIDTMNYNNDYNNSYSDYNNSYGDYNNSYNGNNSDMVSDKKDDYESGKKECQTCKNRKYQDGSDEMVSFKSAAHISPESAASAVRSHEQEHVSNAYKKASMGNGQVVSANVSIHTSICPECGRSYVSGGTTSTQIKYINEDNRYQQELKSQDKGRLTGMFFDAAV